MVDDFIVNGFEVEGCVYFWYGNYYVCLDINFWEIELDKSEILLVIKVFLIWVYEFYFFVGMGVVIKSGGYYICYKSDDGVFWNLVVFFMVDGEV